MNIPPTLSEKLLLLLKGEKIPAGKIRHPLISEMLDNGILQKQMQGRNKAIVYLVHTKPLNDFLHNHYGISNLQEYVNTLHKNDLTRSEVVASASDSKLKKIRTFKGFLINCYTPVQATLNGKPLFIKPSEGTFHFIYDFESFSIPDDVTVVGVENAENFRYIERQKYLFENIKPLFISRYPQNQSKDLLKWLLSITNSYLHFGDFDFDGIGIYLNEYKKHLGDRACFFVPADIEHLISQYGNKKLYDRQRISFDIQSVKENNIRLLIETIHQYKKGLEQELFIKKQE